jgi:chromosomal replication initiator protein
MSGAHPTGKAWDQIAAILRRSLPRQQFDTWFRGMRVVSLSPDRAELSVPNNFLREWIQKKYRGVLRAALREVCGGDPALEIRIGEDGDPAPSAAEPEAAVAEATRTESYPPAHGESDIVLNPQYTFENFIPGPSNNFAHAAALAVAESPGKSYNPLFLHGSVGLGKTHLLQAICHRLMSRRPGMRILYLSCETFTNHFVAAVANGELDSFRYRYRHVDVLLIDDIHFLANRERTQEEFFHTFNTLYNANKQIILSSDSTPAEIPTLEERLVSRFKWGVVARIDPPVYETRLAILRRKVDAHGIPFPDEVLHFLAENVVSNIRELEGAVNKLAGLSRICHRAVEMEMARETVRDLVAPGATRVSIDGIIRTVAEHYGVRVSDLQSKRRTKSIAFPRQVCMFLARRLTSHSLEEIGGYFGGRDHTTVMYAFDKIRREVQSNAELSSTLERLSTALSS